MQTVTTELTIEDRRNQVQEYVYQGYSLRMIATRLGVSHTTISKDYQTILESLFAQRKALGELHVEEHLQLLDRKIDRLDERSELMFTDDKEKRIPYDDRVLNTLARYIEMKARLLAMPGYTGNAPTQSTAMQINISYNGNNAAQPQYEIERSTVQGKARAVPHKD